jgi:SSS family solute:Na+ symporter
MLTRRVPAMAAKLALLIGFSAIAIGYFVPPFNVVVESMHEFVFLGTVFSWLVILMLVVGEIRPLETEFEQVDVAAVDMTPWKHARVAGLLLIAIVFTIYLAFADFSVLEVTTPGP